MNDNQVISVSPKVVACELDEGLALLQTERSFYYTLNVVGSAIFKLIDSSKSANEIVTLIQQRYEIPHEVAKADVMTLLLDLEREKLVLVC